MFKNYARPDELKNHRQRRKTSRAGAVVKFYAAPGDGITLYRRMLEVHINMRRSDRYRGSADGWRRHLVRCRAYPFAFHLVPDELGLARHCDCPRIGAVGDAAFGQKTLDDAQLGCPALRIRDR